jgi:lipopolysaccharide export system protein LptC
MGDRLSGGFAIVILALLAGLTYWLDQLLVAPVAPRVKPPAHEPDYVVDKLLATRMNLDGRVRDTLRAERMMHFPQDDSTAMTRPRFMSFVTGAPLAVTSNTARASSNGGDLYFEGDVTVTRAPDAGQGELRVQTQYLHVMPDDNVARTDRPVILSGAGSVIHAGGMDLNAETRVLKLTGGVRGVFQAEPAGKAAAGVNRR